MADQKLTGKSAITTVNNGSWVHVVQNGTSHKVTKSNFQKNITSGFIGSIVSSSSAPTEDGLYICRNSGTYTNYGSLVVDITTYVTFISVEDTQTNFYKIEYPFIDEGYYIVDDLASFDSLITASTPGTWLIISSFTLDANKTLPTGVTLEFRGGVINGGGFTLTGAKSKIIAEQKAIFDTNITLGGTWDVLDFYPEWFGAIGDGSTDDAAPCQLAIDLTDNANWQGNYYCSTNITISESNKKISRLELTDCALYLDATANSISNIVIKGLKVYRASLLTNTYGIVFDAGASYTIRDITITECRFENLDKAIYSPPTGNAFHNRGTIIINNNFTDDCNYATYFDVATGSKDANCINDVHITDNVFYSLINDVYFKSADGCVIANNTMFGSGGTKSYGVHVSDGQTDQIKINGNQIFEAQSEAILLEKVKQFQINDNNLVKTITPLYVVSSIRCLLNGVPAASTVNNNSIRSATKHGIELIASGASVYTINTHGNTIYCYDSTTVDGTDLSTIDHYGVYAEGSFNYVNADNIALSLNNVELDSINGTTNQLLTRNATKVSSVRTFKKAITLDASTKTLFTTSSTTSSLLIFIQAYYTSGSTNNSTYLLATGSNAAAENITTIHESGLIGGAAPDNHPSFTWSVSSGAVTFGHKNGTTTGLSYTFEVTVMGKSLITV